MVSSCAMRIGGVRDFGSTRTRRDEKSFRFAWPTDLNHPGSFGSRTVSTKPAPADTKWRSLGVWRRVRPRQHFRCSYIRACQRMDLTRKSIRPALRTPNLPFIWVARRQESRRHSRPCAFGTWTAGQHLLRLCRCYAALNATGVERVRRKSIGELDLRTPPLWSG